MLKFLSTWLRWSLAAFLCLAIAIIIHSGGVFISGKGIPSPSRTAILTTQRYIDEDNNYTLYLTLPGIIDSSTQLISIMSLRDRPYTDLPVVGWEGDNHLTIGWSNGHPIQGVDQVGDIHITYKSYEPDLDKIASTTFRSLKLHDTTLSFKEVDKQYGDARYTATNEPVPNIQCIIEATGAEGKIYNRITVQIIGNGIGHSTDPYKIVAGIGIKYIFSEPVKQLIMLTPIQAQISGLIESEVPDQTDTFLYYQHYNAQSASNLFSYLKLGKLAFKVGLNFGQQILDYDTDIHLTDDIIRQFNACSAKTNIYGVPFSIPTGNANVTH